MATYQGPSASADGKIAVAALTHDPGDPLLLLSYLQTDDLEIAVGAHKQAKTILGYFYGIQHA